MRGQLLEITTADLQFTTQGTAIYLNGYLSLNLSPKDIATLTQCPRGWVVGLKLALLAMRTNNHSHHIQWQIRAIAYSLQTAVETAATHTKAGFVAVAVNLSAQK